MHLHCIIVVYRDAGAVLFGGVVMMEGRQETGGGRMVVGGGVVLRLPGGLLHEALAPCPVPSLSDSMKSLCFSQHPCVRYHSGKGCFQPT